MGKGFTESVVEEAALAWLESLGYAIKHGPAVRAGSVSKQTDREAIVPAYRRRQLVQKMHQLKREGSIQKKCILL